MRSAASWFTVLPATVAIAGATSANATVYLTVALAQHEMFPGARFDEHFLPLSPEQRRTIAKMAGAPGYDSVQRVWEARNANRREGWFILDRVIGKHEFITYAVALAPDGAIQRVEILEYRETYGGEIRNERWRQQFVGKRFGAPLKLDGDIRNISGATLSSRHVTDGVRRLLATYQLLLANG